MTIRLFTPSELPILVTSASSPKQFTTKQIEGVVIVTNNTSVLGNVTLTDLQDTIKNNVVPILPSTNQRIAFGKPQDSVKVTNTSLLIQPGYMNKLENSELVTPLTINDLFMWYDPSDLSTLFQDRIGASAVIPALVNDPVGTMFDKSGNNHHMIALTDDGRPILRSSGNTFWLEFNGSTNFLTVDYPGIPYPIDNIVAFRLRDRTQPFPRIFEGHFTANISANRSLAFFPADTTLEIFTSLTHIDLNYTIGIDAVLTARFNGTASRGALDNNNYTTGTLTAPVSNEDQFQFAKEGGGTSFTSLDLYGFVRATRLLSDNETSYIRTYLAAKQGRTL